MSLERIVAEIVTLNGGLKSGAAFVYHRWGPFSADVVTAWEFAELLHPFRTSKRQGKYEPYIRRRMRELVFRAHLALKSRGAELTKPL